MCFGIIVDESIRSHTKLQMFYDMSQMFYDMSQLFYDMSHLFYDMSSVVL